MTSITPLNIYNGMPKGVPQNIKRQLSSINQLKCDPPQEDYSVSNVRRFITTYDLKLPENKNKFSLELLVKNIDHLDGKTLLHTQILNAEFCVKYILSMDDNDGVENSYLLCEDYILELQPHIDEKEFMMYRNQFYSNYYSK